MSDAAGAMAIRCQDTARAIFACRRLLMLSHATPPFDIASAILYAAFAAFAMPMMPRCADYERYDYDAITLTVDYAAMPRCALMLPRYLPRCCRCH